MFSKKDLENFFQDLSQQVAVILTPQAVDQLCEIVQSSEAQLFTSKMNKQYRDEKTIGADGEIIQVKTPTDLRSRMRLLADGNYQFNMSLEEDRWFRANQLFGNNITKKVGFKYTNISQ